MNRPMYGFVAQLLINVTRIQLHLGLWYPVWVPSYSYTHVVTSDPAAWRKWMGASGSEITFLKDFGVFNKTRAQAMFNCE